MLIHSYEKKSGTLIVDFPGDLGESCIVNEAALRCFGWVDPLGKKINDNQWTIVGVVEDYHLSDIHNQIDPPDTVKTAILDCVFSTNTASAGGGAIALSEHGYAWIERSTFSGNQSVTDGGGIAILETPTMGSAFAIIVLSMTN